jgi:hypothetical protein
MCACAHKKRRRPLVAAVFGVHIDVVIPHLMRDDSGGVKMWNDDKKDFRRASCLVQRDSSLACIKAKNAVWYQSF